MVSICIVRMINNITLMKKMFLGMALTLMTVLTVLSCGKKTAETDGVKIEQNQYSVVLPTGWEQATTGSDSYESLNLTKKVGGTTMKLAFHVYANTTSKPAAMMKSICREKNGWEYQPSQELGDNTWSIAYAPNANSKYAARHCAFTALKTGVLYVQLENIDINDPEAKAILESVEVK